MHRILVGRYFATFGPGTLIVLIASALNSVAPLLIAQNWGVENYGIFAGFWSLITIIGFATLAIQTTVATQTTTSSLLSKKGNTPRIHLDRFTLSLLIPSSMLVVLCALIAFFRPVTLLTSNWTLVALSIVLFSSILSSIAFGRFVASKNFQKLYLINLLLALLKIVTILLLALFDIPIRNLILVFVWEQLLTSLMLFWATQSYGRIQKSFLHSSNLKPSLLTLMVWSLFYADILLIRSLSSPEVSGLYAAASSLTKLALLPLTLIMNRNYSDRNQDSRQLLSSNVFQTAAMFLPTLIILLFIFSFKENIVPRIFGDGFDSIGAYIPYAILANLPWFFLLLLTSKLLAKVHVREIIFVLVSSMGYFFVVTQLLSDWREYTVLHFALGLTLFFGIEFRNQAIRSR
jgi:O-antigen/teichoic acid export membrane protein